MKMKRLGSLLLAGAMMAATLTGCGGGGGGSDDGTTADGKSTVTLWATGSDNVRAIFETLCDDFNTNSEYADKYQVELQFMLSGTGAQTLADSVSAAIKAGQENTDYDIVDWSGDDLSKIVSQVGEEAFVKLDRSNPECRFRRGGELGRGRLCTALPRHDRYPGLRFREGPHASHDLGRARAVDEGQSGRFAYNTPGTGGAATPLPARLFTTSCRKRP